MGVPNLRPPVCDMIFQLYGRPMHPELFEIEAERTVVRGEFTLTCWITRTGHVITFENHDVLLSEVTASSDQPMPEKRRLLRHRLRNEYINSLSCAHGIQYQMNSQVEVLSPELFQHVHREIIADGRKRGLLHNFPADEPAGINPLGYLTAASREDCIFLSSFHTFPSEHTIVKTQSLIEKTR